MKNYSKEYNRFSELEKNSKRPSSLIVFLVAFILVLTCSLGYKSTGVSTEGSTSEILERLMQKDFQNLGY